MRLSPPLRQQRDRDALAQGLLDGTIDALVSDHTPVSADAKTLPFAEAEAGATGLELLLPLALKWGASHHQVDMSGAALMRALAVLTIQPARVLGSALGHLQAGAGQLLPGSAADVCVFDAAAQWALDPTQLRSQGKHTPFAGHQMPGRVRYTVVDGQVAYPAQA